MNLKNVDVQINETEGPDGEITLFFKMVFVAQILGERFELILRPVATKYSELDRQDDDDDLLEIDLDLEGEPCEGLLNLIEKNFDSKQWEQMLRELVSENLVKDLAKQHFLAKVNV